MCSWHPPDVRNRQPAVEYPSVAGLRMSMCFVSFPVGCQVLYRDKTLEALVSTDIYRLLTDDGKQLFNVHIPSVVRAPITENTGMVSAESENDDVGQLRCPTPIGSSCTTWTPR